MIIFITGGARSGKSNFAESIYKDKTDVVYIATAKVEDEEMENRVLNHKKSRPSYWRTFEAYRGLSTSIGEENYYLLDCLTVMTSNIMFDLTKNMDRIGIETEARIESEVLGEIKELINLINKKNKQLVIVTNEIGSSLVPDYHISRVFRDVQGRINQKIGQLADEAYLVVAGFPVRLK